MVVPQHRQSSRWTPDRHLAAVVGRRGVVHRHLVWALDGVVGRDEGELRRGGVLNRDGLGGRRAVSSIVGGREVRTIT